MNKSEIEKILGCSVGICDFECLKDKLIECRKKKEIPENAKSVILFIFPYKVKNSPPQNICRYASVPDYHSVCGNILNKYCDLLKKAFKNNQFVYFIDNSPINEVYAAARSGLGVIGKNGLLITEKYGSFVFIGEIVTDLYISAENKLNFCINCGACLNSCPVSLDKTKCLSKITQKKGELESEEKFLIKKYGTVWGCDICADVCPLNKNAENTYIKDFINGYRNSYTVGEDITNRAFSWRGEKVVKRNAELLKE